MSTVSCTCEKYVLLLSNIIKNISDAKFFNMSYSITILTFSQWLVDCFDRFWNMQVCNTKDRIHYFQGRLKSCVKGFVLLTLLEFGGTEVLISAGGVNGRSPLFGFVSLLCLV